MLLVALLLSVAGCTDPKAFGVSRWPAIDVPPPLEYTPEELAALGQFSQAHPELARKIVNQSQSMRAAIDEYNRRAWQVNARQLKTLGYTGDDIERLLGPKPTGAKDEDSGPFAPD